MHRRLFGEDEPSWSAFSGPDNNVEKSIKEYELEIATRVTVERGNVKAHIIIPQHLLVCLHFSMP